MEFDRFTVALLIRRDDAPELDQDAESALQDAHMAGTSAIRGPRR